MRILPFALLLTACSGGTVDDKDDTDTDVADTDTTDTDVADTDVADTDETDVAADNCTLTPIPTVTQAAGEPGKGEMVTFRRVVQTCVSATAWSGSWSVVVTDESDEQVCRFEVLSSGSTTTEDCEACDLAFSDVTYAAGSFSDATLCGLFGLDSGFVDGLNSAYTGMGVTTDPDILFEGLDSWDQLDDSASTVRTRTEHDDGSHVSLTFETSYAY